MKSSQKAIDLIINFEVTSKAYYEKHYQSPEWPGGASGVTIGIGYDLGYSNIAEIESDWKGIVSDSMLEYMKTCANVKGDAAKALTKKMQNKISIPWDIAIKVFSEKTVPKWESRLEKELPNTDKLTSNQYGALVSLIYNRGYSFRNPNDRYKEMRNILKHMQNEEFNKIPAEFKSMKRIWPNVEGLRRRRDAEAKLFESK